MSRRIACLDVPALPLQLLAQQHPSWADSPLAVVEDDHPQARLLWVDDRAAACRIRIGMRYAAALQLSRDLRAAPVELHAIAEAQERIVEAMQRRTPRVELDHDRAGVFWLDPDGMTNLFGPLERWARHVHGGLVDLGFHGWVTVGFARLPTWAVGRIYKTTRVLRSPAEEAELAGPAPLVTLDVPPELRDALSLLGIVRLDQFLSLPRGELGARFGPAARELHALFADARQLPMQPRAFPDPIVIDAELQPPDDDRHRLLFCIKGALHALMAELSMRALALGALELTFELECADSHSERIEPARETRDAIAVLELVRLRLSSVELPSLVERVVLRAEPARLDGTQLSLFAGRRKDPAAAGRSIARLRAAFGDAAVTRAALRDGWLPEQTFAFVPTDRVEQPGEVGSGEVGLFVRRVFREPIPVSCGRDARPTTVPPLTAMSGPYRLEGGWWVADAVRDYFFAEREDGALLWLFRDRRRARWFLHGRVE